MQSDCSDHVCRLHSTASCDESLPPELQVHVQNTAHKTDAPKHTYHVSSSMHDHNDVWFAYQTAYSYRGSWHKILLQERNAFHQTTIRQNAQLCKASYR